jgi:hypothetical protein
MFNLLFRFFPKCLGESGLSGAKRWKAGLMLPGATWYQKVPDWNLWCTSLVRPALRS